MLICQWPSTGNGNLRHRDDHALLVPAYRSEIDALGRCGRQTAHGGGGGLTRSRYGRRSSGGHERAGGAALGLAAYVRDTWNVAAYVTTNLPRASLSPHILPRLK